MKWLQRAWHAIAEPFRFLEPLRFVAVPLALLLWALIWSDQGQDAVRAVIEVHRRCPHWGSIVLFCLAVTATALQAWYWSRQLLRIDFPRCVDEPGEVSGARRRLSGRELAVRYPGTERWVPRLLGAAVFAIALAALGRAAYNTYSGRWEFSLLVAVVTALLLVALLAAFLRFVVVRRRRLGAPPQHVASHRELGPITRWILDASLGVAALFVVWTALSPLTAGRVFPAPSLLMVSAALWVGIGSFVVYWFDRYRVPVVATFLPLAMAFSCFNDNHTVRTLTAAQGGGDPQWRQPFDPTFEAWYAKLQARYPGEPAHPIFIVATEGGGIRAAYWTAAVLTAIQDQAPQFADHLFAISSVSGGSLGSMVFTSLLADRQRVPVADACDVRPDPALEQTLRFAAQQMLSYDFLAPTLGSMLHADLVQRFLPWGFIPDRARALETGWEAAYRAHAHTAAGGDDDFFAGGMLKMYAARRDAPLPSLFLNSTSVEVGNRVIASNVDLRDGAIPDAVDLLSRLGRDMRLSTAALNSARFTYVSPAGSVHDAGGKLLSHVVDGGYFENSGAQTALDVIDRIERIRGDRRFNLHLILIKFQQVATRQCAALPPPPVPPERFMDEALSPLRALLATRDARGTLAYDEAVDLPEVTSHPFLLTQRDHGIVMPLGWLLAPRTRDAIDLQVGPATPPDIDCAIRPYVEANVSNLQQIALLVSGRPLPAELDAVQQDARQSESKATH